MVCLFLAQLERVALRPPLEVMDHHVK
ncbi:hypothetical protein NSPZN2_100139 [Nitrospira defluvii]|uniref:Uncharacterized protein n=1 Tax=Nitrospira defluvii TaxID=330214 RepID=A0ABM8R0R9_9BACT|nr:hypothetical protein NSPZN2_100139 [Nitrospira defluvii]